MRRDYSISLSHNKIQNLFCILKTIIKLLFACCSKIGQKKPFWFHDKGLKK